MAARGLIVAAPRSGSGKTVVTMALLAALRQRGVRVRAAKSGPDYIDPGFHEAATGQPSLNLDSWAMPPGLLDGIAQDLADGTEIVVIEAAMGLFDGIDAPPGARGSAADLSARFGLPVLLVLDVSGQMQSAAAIARGFMAHDPEVPVAGVVLNRVASPRHRNGIEQAMQAAGIPVLGSIMRDAGLQIPERHLGLLQAEEHAALASLLDRLGSLDAALELDAILALAAPLAAAAGGPATALPPPGQRIALARDAAFSFIYPHLLAGWRGQGAEIVTFSPLADQKPPGDCDACWLPGGYPELHAVTLGAATRFKTGLTRFAETRPVHGECGGYMVLGNVLEDADGTSHAMAGLLHHRTSFARRRLHLGYRQARLLADGPLGAAGTMLRGHEFHYATLTDGGADEALAAQWDAGGTALGPGGSRRGFTTGSFFHVIATCGAA